ncbi:hypothetical protein VTK56DRAFT_5573 [Thermocarpiscus australiensis]
MDNTYYPSPLSPEDAQQRLVMQRTGPPDRDRRGVRFITMGTPNQGGPYNEMTPMLDPHPPPSGADSLDDIVRQNTHVLRRRRSVSHPFAGGSLEQRGADQRMPTMGFGSAGEPRRQFQFDFGDLHGDVAANLGGLASSAAFPGGAGSSYTHEGLMGMPPDRVGYATMLPADTAGNMAAFPSFNMGQMGAGLGAGYPPTGFGTASPNFAVEMAVGVAPVHAASVSPVPAFPLGVGGDMLSASEHFDSRRGSREPPSLTLDPNLGSYRASLPPSVSREVSEVSSFQSPASAPSRAISHHSGRRPNVVSAATPASIAPPPPPNPSTAAVVGPVPAPAQRPEGSSPKLSDPYSKSGFDMLRALWYVATRKNPTLQIGAVDMSCAFIVCDVKLADCPIVYASDNFQNLTGYRRHEIVGRNCRFLQSPDGHVEGGSRREFVENEAVFKLKRAVDEGREIQQSLINYRKGGKPFLNLLTMIPIPWDSDEIRYFIGFQIDLVECPEAISGEQSTGAMQVNYRHSDIGQYVWSPPSLSQWEPESGQTLGVDEVSALLLQEFNPKGPVPDGHRQKWDKMLLENADDVVHVLSLKGVFLYLSPSCKKVLEYDARELMGTSLASICHPSDIVPVTRELKDAQQDAPVNVAFRICRKHSGYMWFESHGTLFSEQGKGRKWVILVGRQSPVFALCRKVVRAHGGGGGGGVTDSEMWAKMSTSGMFLHVSSAARALLDLQPRDLEGTSMQDLIARDSRPEFGRTIDKARRGRIVSFSHELLHRRGQVLPAQTTFYPGDVPEGRKPTFLVARTRLSKSSPPSSRAVASATGGGTGGGTRRGSTMAAAAAGVVLSENAAHADAHAPQLEAREAAMADNDDDDGDDDDDMFDELQTTRPTSWQFELRQMERANRALAEELAQLMGNKKKRKRRKGGGGGLGAGGGGGRGGVVRDCANCHKRDTPEWRRGPSGNRDLCNSCGLRWAKQTGKVSPRSTHTPRSDAAAGQSRIKSQYSSLESSPLQRELLTDDVPLSRGTPAGGSGSGFSAGRALAGATATTTTSEGNSRDGSGG